MVRLGKDRPIMLRLIVIALITIAPLVASVAVTHATDGTPSCTQTTIGPCLGR